MSDDLEFHEMNDGVQQQNPDGSWSPAEPMGWQGDGIDAEMTWSLDQRRYVWVLYDKYDLVAKGTSRSELLAVWQIARAKRRYRKSLRTTRSSS